MATRAPIRLLAPRGRCLAAILLGLIVALCTGTGCDEQSVDVVRMATTTSTANTGLLDYLMAEFHRDTGIRVDFIATGTGKALKHARNGDVDLVLVHAPPAEETFVRDGFGVKRVPLMWNDFVILGPPEDPAAISESAGAVAAFTRLSERGAPFVSRGDESGTHMKELSIWEEAGVEPAGAWYLEAGQGMGACLTMANERMAYVLADRGTYLAMKDRLELTIVLEGDPQLLNPYAIIAVSPEKHPDVNYEGAQRLIRWMTSPRGQGLISGFRVDGNQLFHLFEGEAE